MFQLCDEGDRMTLTMTPSAILANLYPGSPMQAQAARELIELLLRLSRKIRVDGMIAGGNDAKEERISGLLPSREEPERKELIQQVAIKVIEKGPAYFAEKSDEECERALYAMLRNLHNTHLRHKYAGGAKKTEEELSADLEKPENKGRLEKWEKQLRGEGKEGEEIQIELSKRQEGLKRRISRQRRQEVVSSSQEEDSGDGAYREGKILEDQSLSPEESFSRRELFGKVMGLLEKIAQYLRDRPNARREAELTWRQLKELFFEEQTMDDLLARDEGITPCSTQEEIKQARARVLSNHSRYRKDLREELEKLKQGTSRVPLQSDPATQELLSSAEKALQVFFRCRKKGDA